MHWPLLGVAVFCGAWWLSDRRFRAGREADLDSQAAYEFRQRERMAKLEAQVVALQFEVNDLQRRLAPKGDCHPLVAKLFDECNRGK
jgi:hypothetical protein